MFGFGETAAVHLQLAALDQGVEIVRLFCQDRVEQVPGVVRPGLSHPAARQGRQHLRVGRLLRAQAIQMNHGLPVPGVLNQDLGQAESNRR